MSVSGRNPQDDFFDNLNKVANDCRAKLLSVSQYYLGETDRLESIFNSYPLDQFSHCLTQLNESKREIFKVIEAYFNKLEENIRTRIAGCVTDQEIELRAQDIFERISMNQKAISELSIDLNSKENLLDAMQVVRETDYELEKSNIKNEIDEFENLAHQNKTSLNIDLTVLEQLKDDLYDYVYIRNPDDSFHDTKDQSKKRKRTKRDDIVYHNSPMKLGGTIYEKGSKKTSTYQYELESTPKSQPNETERKKNTARKEQHTARKSDISDVYPGVIPPSEEEIHQISFKRGSEEVEASVKETERARKSSYQESHRNIPRNNKVSATGPLVSVEDYFDENSSNQYLHFFQDNSKKLHILDLKKAVKSGVFEFEEIELDITFKIPIWHRSIITKQGLIYLTGGSGGGITKDKNFNDVYIYDPIDQTLKQKAKMNYARNSHGICVFQDHIYVVGGCIDEEGYTTQCERYEINKYYQKSVGQWEKIAPLNKSAYAPTLVNLNDAFLYKIGGVLNLQTINNFIERYDPRENIWTEITYNLSGINQEEFSLTAYAGCVPITEDEIIIFGGSNIDQKTNQTFVFRTSSKIHVIKKVDIALPYHGIFWNNGLVYEGRVYCLQNIQLNKSDAFFLSKRRLLCYDGDSWDEINTDHY